MDTQSERWILFIDKDISTGNLSETLSAINRYCLFTSNAYHTITQFWFVKLHLTKAFLYANEFYKQTASVIKKRKADQ